MEQVSDLIYWGCGLDESGADVAKHRRKVTSGRNVEGSIRSLINARGLQLERVLHEILLIPVLLYSSETMMGREKERSRNTFINPFIHPVVIQHN